MSLVNDFIEHTRKGLFTPRMYLTNGQSLSVQASEGAYCSPRRITDWYSSVEVGFPSEKIDSFMEYAEEPESPLDTVYPYTPTSLVDEYIKACGGISWELTNKRIAINDLHRSEKELGL